MKVTPVYDLLAKFPFTKVVSLLCTAQLLREDLLGSQSLAHSFVRTGLLRCILESATNRTQSDKEIVSSVHTLQHLRAIFIFFIPLCLSESGWKGLFEEHAVERLSALPLWKAPPKQAFIAKKRAPLIALFIDSSGSVGLMSAKSAYRTSLSLEPPELGLRVFVGCKLRQEVTPYDPSALKAVTLAYVLEQLATFCNGRDVEINILCRNSVGYFSCWTLPRSRGAEDKILPRAVRESALAIYQREGCQAGRMQLRVAESFDEERSTPFDNSDVCCIHLTHL
uniref:Uncharacterized protein n=1 Tax=Ascaris lumbricoides TaxID=6252 RepID=A0A0M3HW21_ASCLU